VDRSDFLKYSALLTFLPFMSDLKSLEHVTQSFISTPKMPVLFLGHGNPMYAIEENIFTQGFKEISIKIPQPSAIVCISAHWLTNGTYVTAMQQPKTIHDFGGFPKALFDVQYPAKGSPELAAETKDLITSTEIGLDHEWGLDHGTWSVLKHLYPLADVPVIQLSIDYGKPASYHFELARQLQSLRNKGVLIVGSGNIVHNLGRVDFPRMNELNYGYDWAKEASQIFNQLILDRNDNGLINYLQLGEAVKLAVPTPDHFYPLIYAAALRDKSDEVKLFNDTMVAGSLSMTSVLYA
jgi:4,5-DOPA dioxygenase extradiol